MKQNQIDMIIDFLSKLDNAKIERCCHNLRFPPRNRTYWGDYLDSEEPMDEYLVRILDNSWIKIRKLIESCLDPVLWINNNFYVKWVDIINQMLRNSKLIFNPKKCKVEKLSSTLEIPDKLNEYLLKINKLNDYVNALKCRDQNFHIASMLYLRRVIEELVYLSKPELRNSTDKRFDFLYKQVKDKFSPLINKHLGSNYHLISEFIHASNEVEASKYFPPLKHIIDIELYERAYEHNIPLKVQSIIEKTSVMMFDQVKNNQKKG